MIFFRSFILGFLNRITTQPLHFHLKCPWYILFSIFFIFRDNPKINALKIIIRLFKVIQYESGILMIEAFEGAQQTKGWTDRHTNRQKDEPTGGPTYRDATTRNEFTVIP